MNTVSISFKQSELGLSDLVKIRDFSSLSFEQVRILHHSGKDINLVELSDELLYFKSQVIVDFIHSLESEVVLKVDGKNTSLETLQKKAKEAKGFNRGNM